MEDGNLLEKSLYALLEQEGSMVFPPSQSIFAWWAFSGNILTLDNAQQRVGFYHIDIFFIKWEEHVNCLLLHYGVARILWQPLFSLFGYV